MNRDDVPLYLNVDSSSKKSCQGRESGEDDREVEGLKNAINPGKSKCQPLLRIPGHRK